MSNNNFMDDMDDSAEFFENLRKQVTDENRQAKFSEPKSSNNITIIWLSVLVGTLLAAIIAYGVFGSLISGEDDSNIPVVRKDVADIKIRPDTPGGMNIPDQDKLVYNRLNADEAANGEAVERIMPRAQRPSALDSSDNIISADADTNIKPVDTQALPTPTSIEDLMKSVDEEDTNKRAEETKTEPFTKFADIKVGKIETTPKPEHKELAKVEDKIITPVPVLVTPKKTANINKPEVVTIKKPKKIEIPTKNIEEQAKKVKTVAAKTIDKNVAQKAAPKPKVKPKSSIKSVTKPKSTQTALNDLIAKTSSVTKATTKVTKLNGWGVQLLSSKSKSAVEKSWKQISKKHSALKGVPHNIVRANLGSKGVYYRLRVGSYSAKSSASKLCKSLKARKQDCMVVKNK